MVSGFISRIVILIFGTLYPAYASYKAVRTKNVKEYVKWMMYWIVFALFTCIETFTDLFLSFWFPFYYEIKIITVIYLLSPATNGSSILYRKFVHPVLIKREQEIDEYIAKAKEQGYHTVLNLGSKGVTYATSLIMQTAIKGGGGLFNQLKKSYSLNDLSEDQRSQISKQDFNDEVDSRFIDGAGVVHRRQGYSPRHTISGPGYPETYFSEMGAYQGPLDLDEKHFRYSREIPLSGISSGYSSEDSIAFGGAYTEPALVRTASLGPTSRIRTRASSKNALPKRASLAEGGSAWSMEEPRESQLDSEGPYHVPWTRSLSLPYSVSPLSQLIKPEYQHLLRQMSQEQMLAFFNCAQCDPIAPENVCLDVKNDLNKNVEATSGNSSEIISDAKNVIEKDCSVVPPQIVDDKKSTAEVSNVEAVLEKSKEEKQSEIKTNKEETALTGSERPQIADDKKSTAEVTNVEVVSEKSKTEKQSEVKTNKEENVSTGSERSGKYNKRPAPVPPNEDAQFKSCVSSPIAQEKEDEEEDGAFITPNASPTLTKKLNISPAPGGETVITDNETINDPDKPKMDSLQVPKKTKVKGKKISKKLHLPKMSFSFWGQKSTKAQSESESSSIASSDNVLPEGENNNDKNDLEVFISLHDEKAHEEDKGQEQKNSDDPSIK